MSLLSRIRTVLTMGQGIVGGLPELADAGDPFDLFRTWYADAERSGILLPEAMTLATATKAGVPSARQVLMKSYDPAGFVFFTNYGSRKSDEMGENPRAALLFHWGILERQVRIEGTVSRTTEAESEAYFRTRPRGSQIGAWASDQSARVGGRAELETKFKEVEARYSGQDVPLPPFWGGFRLRAFRFEFWQGRLNRLHDRLAFDWDEDRWNSSRLNP